MCSGILAGLYHWLREDYDVLTKEEFLGTGSKSLNGLQKGCSTRNRSRLVMLRKFRYS
jgi:hypothetical protein